MRKNNAPWMAHPRFGSSTRSRFFTSKPGDWRPDGKWPPRRGAGHADKRPALRRRRRTCAVNEWFSRVSGPPDHVDVTWDDGR